MRTITTIGTIALALGLLIACGGTIETDDETSEGGAAGGETSDGGAGGTGGQGGEGGMAPTCDPFPSECETDDDCGGIECGVCGDWAGAEGPMTCIACDPGPAECDG